MTARSTTTPLAYVTAGRKAIGHIIARGKLGFEAFDSEERSLGLYPTAPAAANAVFDASANKGGTAG